MRALCCLLLLGAAPEAIWVDAGAEVGLKAVLPNGGEKTKKWIIETTGSGVVVFDFDQDGRQDIFLVSGEGAPSRLYRNLGGYRFADVTEAAGFTRTGWGQGGCAGDLNGDGLPDLVVTYWGEPSLYFNLGSGRFREERLPQKGKRYNTGCALIDYDRDGDLDLFIANYLEFDFATTPLPGANPYCFYRNMPVNCGPRGLPFARNLLYRNNGKGKFEDVSVASGVAEPDQNYALSAVVLDANDDGWPDIYVACDQTASLLYINQKNGKFTEEALLRGVALDEDGRALSGMGVAAGDFDNDGHIDLFRTNFSDERVTLYRNRGDGSFDEATMAAGLGVHTSFVGWGAAFLDFDNDGRRDLVQVNGHVFPELGQYRQRALAYRNVGGKFVEAPAPAGLHSSRGLAVGDFENDGTLAVVVNHQNEAPSFWKPVGKLKGNWLKVAAPVGTRVRVLAGGVWQVDEVRAGGSYLSQHDARLHFGLGVAKKVDQLEVRWPDGKTSKLAAPAINQQLTIKQ